MPWPYTGLKQQMASPMGRRPRGKLSSRSKWRRTLFEAVGERPRGREPSHASADHDGLLANLN
jgi:hypothetical protein